MWSLLLLCWTCCLAVHASVLVPTYVLPPSSFMKTARDQRSLPATRTLARLAGGHLKLHTLQDNNKDTEKAGNFAKNSFSFVDKDMKSYEDKFAGAVVKTESQNVGWNQGQWDDGMLMSSAGNGKEKGKQKPEKDDDDDKKTLADQVAEGKYGLIQKEIFVKAPTRPGIVSYVTNPETKIKDNHETLGGLKNDDIWLAEDHLLVLKGGTFPEHGPKPGTEGDTWPPIDDYQAPARQVKIPTNPEVPPPFPVRLSDDGPLVFLTPNGSIPAPLYPSEPQGEGYGAFPSETFPYTPPFPFPPQNIYQRNATSGRTPFPGAAFPYIPRNASESPFPFPFPDSLNDGSRPSLPPGAVFLPPPPPRGNLSDLYDEDDPSIYYPPPYSFSYKAENTSKVPAGPLVPGIVLPPPPDFFGPLDPGTPTTTTRPTAHAYPPTSGAPPTAVLRSRPPLTPVYLPAKPESNISDSPDNSIDIVSTPPIRTVTYASRPVQKKPPKLVIIPKPAPHRKINSTTPSTTLPIQQKPIEKKRPSVTIIQKPTKTTLKPVPGSLYDYTDKNQYLDGNSVSPSPQPFLLYGPPETLQDKNKFITSTPVPLTAYYSDPKYENILSQIQFAKQNSPNTRIRPEFYSPPKQNGKSVASFYFYEEPVTKAALTTPVPQTYYEDNNNYYESLGNSGANIQDGYYYNQNGQQGYIQNPNLELRPIPSRAPSPFFFVPQRQGSRTLTQEYFSINQNAKPQANYVQQQQPVQQTIQAQPVRQNSFYDEISNIQQTIDYFTTHRPNTNNYQQNVYREVRQKTRPSQRPVYQFSYQNNNGRPEHNTFRAPKMDPEPFRPMVSYSKPYHVQSEYTTTPESSVIVENQVVTELPQPSKYYTTAKPEDYDYGEQSPRPTVERETSRPSDIRQSSILKKPKRIQIYGPTTSNPVNHGYYTKQEESLFDDITKNYFTIFGQKIENGNRDHEGIAVTTPLRPIEISTIKTPINNNLNIQYANDEETNTYKESKPISLHNDIDVNYRQPRPLINPDSEFIPIVNPQIQAKYQAEKQLQQLREEFYHKQKTQNVQIIKNEPINQQPAIPQYTREQIEHYRRPALNNQQIQQPQRIVANNNNYNVRPQVAEGRPGSLVAYRLPGEGAHVYFLTPQPARPENFKYRTPEEIAALS